MAMTGQVPVQECALAETETSSLSGAGFAILGVRTMVRATGLLIVATVAARPSITAVF